MSNDMEDVLVTSLKNKLLSVLKLDDMWPQFMEVIGKELALQRAKIEKKKALFDVNAQLEDGLLDIAEMFGYTPNLILDQSLLMGKKEVESIPFRIRNKTTYDGYYVNFKQINREGDIYNYYWSGTKLVKATIYQEILDKLNEVNPTKPFVSIYPDKNFSVVSSNIAFRLDETPPMCLDTPVGNKMWELDNDIIIIPTKHLGIEYYLTQMLDENYLINSDYFYYMEKGVEYTRRVPIIPHIGVQLTSIMMENSGYDFFNVGNAYSVPDLRMRCGTTIQYNRFFVRLEPFNLDNNPPQELDQLNMWTLDMTYSILNRPTTKDFFYISCGNDSLLLPDEAHKNIFDIASIVLFYTFGDNDNSYDIKDYSLNEHNATITGETKKIKGIIGKTADFNGSTFVKSDEKILITQSLFSFGFWFKANNIESYNSNGIQYLIDFEFMSCWYVYSEEKLYYTFGTLSGFFDLPHNQASQIIFEVENSVSALRIYLDKELVVTEDISGESISGTYYITVGADSNGEHCLKALIDSVWLLNKLLSQDEKDYIYDEKLSIITHLGNQLACYSLDEYHETIEDDVWLLIQSHVEANDVTSEFGFFADPLKTQFKGQLNFYPIMSDYFELTIINGAGEEVILTADDSGKLYIKETNEYISGEIDFKTGEYTINRQTTKYRTQKLIGSTTYNIQEIIKVTESDETVSYAELIEGVLTPLSSDKIVEIDPELEPYKTTKEYSTDDAEQATVFNDGNRDMAGNLIYYTDFLCTEEYEKPEGVTIQADPVTVYDWYSTALIITPLLHIDIILDADISPSTLVLSFKIDGEKVMAVDDGQGGVAGGHFTGLIDYQTGHLEGDFYDDKYPDGDVLAEYIYFTELDILDDSEAVFRYKVTDSTSITEIGLENKNHEIMAYMTFPPVQFNSIDNHISAMFAIRKG